ncbi:MAG: hypothetical protein DRQ62_14480 [Gammaproteobacteria bacterium]|nr:MAG: hypothetical protein DRQ62_14480 [Gammaproteobacteria bacterium]
MSLNKALNFNKTTIYFNELRGLWSPGADSLCCDLITQRGFMTWINIKEKTPENGKNILVFYKTETGRNIMLIAAYFGKHELESNNDAFGDDLEYCEEKDEYYAPEGWYEYSEHNDEYSYIYFSGIAITHWMNKPEPPAT